MQIKEAIILAGGFGTRLKETVPDLPKCMAPVNARPFLFYVINYLRSQGIEKFIFSLGYKHEVVEAYLQTDFPTLDFQCLVEKEPLGTGGAVLAVPCSHEREPLVRGPCRRCRKPTGAHDRRSSETVLAAERRAFAD